MGFYAVSAIFQPYNGRRLIDKLTIYEVDNFGNGSVDVILFPRSHCSVNSIYIHNTGVFFDVKIGLEFFFKMIDVNTMALNNIIGLLELLKLYL